ncbi:MAG: cardiolipin synthase [Planctomycetia bacterium]|jgi:cardiolipin synthase
MLHFLASWPLDRYVYIVEWIVRIIMLLVLMGRRQHRSNLTWLLVVFFLPVPGMILYLLIGQNRLPSRRASRYAKLLESFDVVRKRFEDHPSTTSLNLAPEFASTGQFVEKLGNLSIVKGNDNEIIIDTDHMIDRLVEDIDNAKEHVHMLYYIFVNDETGRRVAEALARAVQRGVTCRVLVDAVGSKALFKRLGPEMIKQGIQLHAALPVNLFRRRMARIDLRNHRKLAIIDGRIAYSGSQNIVNADYGKKNLAWHDMSVRSTGPIVLQLQAVFIGDWYFETDEILDTEKALPDPTETGTSIAQTLPSGPDYPTENYQRIVVTALYGAQEQVTITSPYFVPDESFMQAMEVAVLRGVKVDLILPQKCDQILVGAASRSYYDELLDLGVNLYLYEPGLLHAKTLSVDDQIALIGSSNFDIRSFALNFEISLIFYGSDMADRLRTIQKEYLENSKLLTQETWQGRGWWAERFENIAKMLSPLL